MLTLTGLQTKLSKQKAITKFLGSGGSIHCGIWNDFRFTENDVLTELIRRRLVLLLLF
jgi:hypothetical protein